LIREVRACDDEARWNDITLSVRARFVGDEGGDVVYDGCVQVVENMLGEVSGSAEGKQRESKSIIASGQSGQVGFDLNDRFEGWGISFPSISLLPPSLTGRRVDWINRKDSLLSAP
jgi:hypothetical protein